MDIIIIDIIIINDWSELASLYQHLSVTIQRGNFICITNSFSPHIMTLKDKFLVMIAIDIEIETMHEI